MTSDHQGEREGNR